MCLLHSGQSRAVLREQKEAKLASVTQPAVALQW